MRVSRVVLSDEEIAAQMKADAPQNESAGETRARIDAALAEREANRATVQASYDKGRGAGLVTSGWLNQAKLYPVQEHTGPITATVGKSSARSTESRTYTGSSGVTTAWSEMSVPHLLNAARKSGNAEMLAYAKAREQGKA